MPKIWPRYFSDISQICPRNIPVIYHICPCYVTDMSQICHRYFQDMLQICLLPRERWDDLSIFKGLSNISVSPALQPSKQPTKQPNKQTTNYQTIVPVKISSIICWTGRNWEIWSFTIGGGGGGSRPSQI